MLVQRLQKLQEKAVWLINFETNPKDVDQLFKDNNILKVTDLIKKYALVYQKLTQKGKYSNI